MHLSSKKSLLLCCIGGALLTACEGKFEKMSREELAELHADCTSTTSPGAAMIQVCKNVKKECTRRRKELNRYDC